MITDVAAADNGHRVVHHQNFVVHSMIHTLQVGEKIETVGSTVGKRVEDANLDVWVSINEGGNSTAITKIHVIQQSTYFYTPVGCSYQTLGQNMAGSILLPDIVLHIQAFFGHLG